jgi:Chitobiase/beta-hexosaminidase C-terminal domain/Beta-propeller repeat
MHLPSSRVFATTVQTKEAHNLSLGCLLVTALLLCWTNTLQLRAQTPDRAPAMAKGVTLRQADGSSGSGAGRARFLKSSMSFEPNVGQVPSTASFIARGDGYLLELRPQGAHIDFAESGDASVGSRGTQPECSLDLRLVGVNRNVDISGEDKLPGVHNYLPTGDPASWHTSVATYREVQYSQIYRGIDLVFYGNPNHLEYDFRLQAHADPSQIGLALGGVDSFATDEEGNLVLRSHERSLRLLKPIAYQLDSSGKRVSIKAVYRVSNEGPTGAPVVTFALGDYDHSRPLTIDPVLDYSFFLPAAVNGYLYIGASTTDAAGNTYIAGTFPAVGRYGGFYSAGFFVAKFSSAGEELYNTSFGTKSPAFQGSINGIAIDSTGKVYLAGEVADGALPATSNAYQTSASSPYANGFLAVVSADGKTLTYATYFGGNAQGYSVAADASGNAYLAGSIGTGFGTYLPVKNAVLSTAPGQFSSGFLAKLNPSASGAESLIYSTFIGAPGSQSSTVNSVAVDKSDNAYVTGNAYTAQYPTTPGALQYNGRDLLNDVFVSKLNASGTAFVYSVLLGPGVGRAITVDAGGDAYLAGTVYEDDFPTTNGAYQTTYPSGFASELNPQGSVLIYSTFLGGGPDDLFASGNSYVVPTNVAIPSGCSSACALYVAGVTTGSDWPLVNQVESYIPGSQYSAFYLELSGNGTEALQSSYIASGSANFDPYQNVPGIGIDSAGDIYLTGDVLTSNLATSQTTAAAGEGFIAKIAPPAGAALFAVPQSVKFPAQVVGVSTIQQGLAQPTVVLENLGTEQATLTSIETTPTGRFAETNSCNGTVPAGGNCTLTLSFTPGPVGSTPQTGSIVVSSNAKPNPTIQLSGTAQNDRYVVASCGGVTPCAGLTFSDTTVGTSAAAQIVTLTNLGDTASPLPTISSSIPDYLLLNNCPQTGSGLPAHASCEISVQFHPTATGLRSGVVTVVATGTSADTISFAATGTGLLSPNSSSLVLIDPVLNFGTETEKLTSAVQSVQVYNDGTAPVTIFAPKVTTSGDATGVSDFLISSDNCTGVLIAPQGSCTIGVEFSPTAAGTRSGSLQIPSSASTTPTAATLTGIGIASTQNLEFSPDSLVFPNQVVNFSSAPANIYVFNAGPGPVTIDRVLIAGSYQITATTCPEATLQPNPSPAQVQTCLITMIFSPKTTGLLTGTITVIDTEGRQSAFSLAGTAVAQAGSILLDADGLYFDPLPVGSSSGTQGLNVYNVGNIPVTVTAIATAGDFAVSHPYCNPPFTLAAGTACGPLSVSFTPTKVASPDSGTLTVTTTAGSHTVSLTGTGEQATKAVLITPPGTNGVSFGQVEVGGTANSYPYSYALNVYNIGTDPVTFSAAPAISATDAADFTVAQNSCPASPQSLAASTSCYVFLQFSPKASGGRSATLTLKDDAVTGSGVQTIALAGTGTPGSPTYTLLPETMTFAPQMISTTSGGQEFTFINHTSAPVTISSVTFGSSSLMRVQNYYGDCNEGPVAANGGQCIIGVAFAPTATGAVATTITLKDSSGKTYTGNIYANGISPAHVIAVTPSGLNFAPQPLLSTSAAQTILLTNVSGTPASIGQATGSNVILGSSKTGTYKVTSDGCSNITFRSDYPNNGCGISVVLEPTASTALGSQAGSITVPVTFRDKTTTDYTITLNGTVVADSDSVEVSPAALTFPDQAVNLSPSTGSSDGIQTVYLTNNSNLGITVGRVTGMNTITTSSATGQFSIWTVPSGDGCSSRTVQPRGYCAVQLAFVPTVAASGVKGALTFPVTFTDGKTQTVTTTYSGNALAAKSSIQITPDSADFGTQIVGQAASGVLFTITNVGNQPLALGAASLSSNQAGTNFTRNGYYYNQCGVGTLAVGASCPVFVQFQPLTTGTINGTLTIADPSASGGPHKIPLVGVGLPANQAITVSQLAVNFGNQPVGVSNSPAAIYISNQSTSNVYGFTYTLGGTNASDFTMKPNNCSTALPAKSVYSGQASCALLVAFSPAKTSLGARSATITLGFTGAGSPIVIKLSGTGIADAPGVALFPNPLNFSTTDVGSKSGAQAFSITNTGSANLTITKLALTNTVEFAISSDACTGKAIAPAGDCLVYVTFSPTLGGNRSGSITVTDNSGGSPQTEQLTGFGYGIPKAVFTPSSESFGNQDLGTTSAMKNVVLSNPGTDTLKLSSLTIAGTNPGDFKQTNNCPATLAPAATCTLTVSFAPEAVGSRSASIVATDNANNVAGSTQSDGLSGTGVGVPKVGLSPASLTFAAQALHTTSTGQAVTLHNGGTGSLLIASITLVGTNAADFAIPSTGNTCAGSLAVNASCTVTITFTPSATGSRSAALLFTDNNGLVTGSQQSVGVTGTGEVQTAIPTFTPAGGTFTSAQSVTLSDTTSGAVIYYTTDGTVPTTSSSRYTSAIKVSANETIQAIAVAMGELPSAVVKAVYIIQ